MNFTIPYIKSCQDQTFYYNAIKDWNALPSSISTWFAPQTKEICRY